MKTDKEIINELNDIFDHFKKHSGKKGKTICEKELSRIQGTLNQAYKKCTSSGRYLFTKNESILLDTFIILKNIIKAIDREAASIETEMHGVQNFSNYEYSKIMSFAYKKELREDLLKMLEHIVAERPEFKEPALTALQ